jgi:alkanesulfonate monooxygenase SsuD/methylene tetrahydromethanopterin reductase-like flavin-dependent oxidoreductase (luciferase family)
MILSEIWTMTDPRDLRAVVDYAVEAERAGFDAVMIGEHVVMGPGSCYLSPPENPRDWLKAGNQPTDYPHPSSLLLLSAIAAATTRIRLLAAAVISPLRHPLLLAKEFATLDLLSQGRLVVLPSVSWQEEEYEALGVPFGSRGKILDEQLGIWKRLWAEGSPITHHGAFYNFDAISMYPEPWGPKGVTLWTGGRTLLPAMRRRLVNYSQGLFLLTPPTAEEFAELAEDLSRAGRKLEDIELAAIVSDKFERSDDRLSIDRVRDNAEALFRQGFSTFIIKPSQFIDDGRDLPDFANEAVSKFAGLGSK